ncbi:hypothetical protein G7074_16410 [Pedobacter sp. HDW13]|uniref:hypothetical protein n=1 Tax=unclassified Pedobacter TaxID=2628915 RepID=UPI000F5A9AF7|nr:MULTISPECIES: hypothetical protein [unclassified Pedobacter]QIL40707.1 hypothetical protein G7074_16410 [Pedobacter sp. HDW13]
MANPQKNYLSHMSRQIGYRATWDPGRPLKIGFIGKLDSSGVLAIYSSLENEGIPMDIFVDDSTADMDFTSSDSVTISMKVSGSAPVLGSALTLSEAGVNFEFKNDEGIVFQTTGNKTSQLINLGKITKLILEKYEDGSWDEDWVVVTELVSADSATIIISNSSGANLDLKANAGIGASGIKITDAALDFSVARQHGSTLKYIAQNGLTPLYKIMGIRDPFIGSVSVEPKDIGEKIVLTRESFRELNFNPDKPSEIESERN